MREPVDAGMNGVVIWFQHIESLIGVGGYGTIWPYGQNHETQCQPLACRDGN